MRGPCVSHRRQATVVLTMVSAGISVTSILARRLHASSRMLRHDSLVIAGAWHIIAGIAALVHDNVYIATP